jgi:hypothetical protein
MRGEEEREGELGVMISEGRMARTCICGMDTTDKGDCGVYLQC